MNEGNLDSNDPGTCARDNGGKVKFSLVPMHLLAGVARVLMHGEKKYKAWNWAKGGKWSQSFDCCTRHMFKFWYCRKDNDDESTLHHIDHAICNLLFLRHNILSYQAGDDRPPAHTMMGDYTGWIDELFPAEDNAKDKTETYQYWVDGDGCKYAANPLAGRFTTPPVLHGSEEESREPDEQKMPCWGIGEGCVQQAASVEDAPVRLRKCNEKISENNGSWTDATHESQKESPSKQVFGVNYWITPDPALKGCNRAYSTSDETRDAQANGRKVQPEPNEDAPCTHRPSFVGYGGGYHHEGGITETNEEGFSDHA